MLLPRTRFRTALTAALADRPLQTPQGQVQRDTRSLNFGSPAGPHHPTTCWIYRPAGTNVEMLFGFYPNFTPDDLICKILGDGEVFRDGSGASIQFNGDANTVDEREHVALLHSGRVTVRSAISREQLVDTIRLVAPRANDVLGSLEATAGWPLRLGSTADVPGLIDRLFV